MKIQANPDKCLPEYGFRYVCITCVNNLIRMKVRHALFIFLLGILVDVIAGTFKILHLPGANWLLYTAVVLKVVGGVVLIVKLMSHPKAKEFLDW